MKKVLVAALIIGMTTPAFADWLEIFNTTYSQKGIDFAVEEAIKGGNAPDPIMGQALTFDGLNPQNIVKALYCAGANGQDIMAAAEKHEISELVVTAGYQNSVEECGDQVADTQAYSGRAVRRGPVFNTPPSGGRGRPTVSPSQP